MLLPRTIRGVLGRLPKASVIGHLSVRRSTFRRASSALADLSSWDAESVRVALQQASSEGSLEPELIQRLRGTNDPGATVGLDDQVTEQEPTEPDRVVLLRDEVNEQAIKVRELKAAGRGNSDDEVKEAVSKLKDLKKQLLEAEAAAAASETAVVNASSELAQVSHQHALVPCNHDDLVRVAELCAQSHVRDFVLLAALATRATPLIPSFSLDVLLRITTAYSVMGVLATPLFDAAASALLSFWPLPAAAGTEQKPSIGQLVVVSRSFASQRLKHEQLFARLRLLLEEAGGASCATPAEALSLLHSYAFLRLYAELGDDLWRALEAKALEPDIKVVGLAHIVELCYVLFLARLDKTRLDDICRYFEAFAELPLPGDAMWSSEGGASLQRRVLLLRAAMRYLHHERYKALPPSVSSALRRVHRMEPPPRLLRPAVRFVRKLSAMLTKLRMGNVCNVERGPFVLDVVERDRKIVYECNHFDRFYAHSTEKIASMCLQERIVKGMGYRVIQVPHWQWVKLKHKKQRLEYLRMSRYYAIKDRREFEPRDELPEDVASNSFDHLGEYFFKKQAPRSHWSWFQPQYDANRRLPEKRV